MVVHFGQKKTHYCAPIVARFGQKEVHTLSQHASDKKRYSIVPLWWCTLAKKDTVLYPDCSTLWPKRGTYPIAARFGQKEVQYCTPMVVHFGQKIYSTVPRLYHALAKKRYIPYRSTLRTKRGTVLYPYGGAIWPKKDTVLCPDRSMLWPKRGTYPIAARFGQKEVQYCTPMVVHFGQKKVQYCTPIIARLGQKEVHTLSQHASDKKRYSIVPLWW